jgi:hypothetical protein
MKRFALNLALRIVLIVIGLLVGQVALVAAAVLTHQKWLLAPLAPGLWSMRFLKADPLTAGSFIVFPTLAQTLLALTVNLAVYAGILFLVMRRR